MLDVVVRLLSTVYFNKICKNHKLYLGEAIDNCNIAEVTQGITAVYISHCKSNSANWSFNLTLTRTFTRT